MNKPLPIKAPIFLALLLATSPAVAAPKSDLWSFWDKSDESNGGAFEHKAWQQTLDTYLVEKGQHNLFNYSAVSTADREALDQYIETITSKDPRSYSLDEQFAYWVNLYNALTVQLILDEYPVKSISKLGGFLSFGPWDDNVATVAGKSLTLNDIEHRILRPIWNDSRIHYAVNCASLSCPNLATDAFTAANTENLLENAALQFTNSEKGARIEGSTLTLSSIYDWYGSDFGDDEQAILREIDKYRDGKKLEGWSGKIKYEYDWSLNQP
ncbi:hypothetical protein A1OW_10840 [Enterovibrio norvegicus]|uniref:DUF547 domain-containing protein n=2 Tax=Enterovibrio norvegicus TaxID=188144 RepID=A0A1I5UB35_9GAMM|nr:DUF547 domain-containing protein [Enterovibrio norvegicus]OEF50879.1 hypothetical protein A1OW_10840 [Enterovibrio norvegicus]OEF59466.1 hypothetical protein A1OU_04210 [Enterovibrio norvegicus]SFP92415.1 Protein of unknown function, DUF547 [Enterovibrio norvegicus DSM 15893]